MSPFEGEKFAVILRESEDDSFTGRYFLGGFEKPSKNYSAIVSLRSNLYLHNLSRGLAMTISFAKLSII